MKHKPEDHPCKNGHDHEIKINDNMLSQEEKEFALSEDFMDRRLYRYVSEEVN